MQYAAVAPASERGLTELKVTPRENLALVHEWLAQHHMSDFFSPASILIPRPSPRKERGICEDLRPLTVLRWRKWA